MCCGLREGERGRFHCRYTVKMNMSTIAVMNMLSRLSLIVLLYFRVRMEGDALQAECCKKVSCGNFGTGCGLRCSKYGQAMHILLKRNS